MNLRPSAHRLNTGQRTAEVRVTVRGRVGMWTKDTMLRAIELGIFDSEQELVATAVTRLVEEEIEPALTSGNFDKSRQSQRRLESMAASAQRMPPPGQTAEQLVIGLERQAQLGEEAAQAYIAEVEQELTGRQTAWGRRVMLALNGTTKWLQARGR